MSAGVALRDMWHNVHINEGRVHLNAPLPVQTVMSTPSSSTIVNGARAPPLAVHNEHVRRRLVTSAAAGSSRLRMMVYGLMSAAHTGRTEQPRTQHTRGRRPREQARSRGGGGRRGRGGEMCVSICHRRVRARKRCRLARARARVIQRCSLASEAPVCTRPAATRSAHLSETKCSASSPQLDAEAMILTVRGWR